MNNLSNNKVIFLSLIGVFLFSCAGFIDSYVGEFFLLNKALSGEEIDKLSHIEILGYIITGFILTQLVNTKYIGIIPLISITLLTIGKLNSTFINDYTSFQVNSLLIASGMFGYISSTLVNIIALSSNQKYLFLSLSLFVWAIGHNVVDVFSHLIHPTIDTLIICTLIYFIIMLITLLNKNEINENFIRGDYNFSKLVDSIELELLTGFTISYLAFNILWYYSAFAIKNSLALSDSWQISHYMIQGTLFSCLPLAYLFTKINKYLTNLLLTLILLTTFYLLPIYGSNLTYNLSLIIVIGICLSAIFICNILILADKFIAQEFRSSIFIYFSVCTIGMYAGTLSSYIPFAGNSSGHFLVSIYIVTGSFILYYLWCFVKRRLYV